MHKLNAPAILWHHCMELMAELRSNTALELKNLNGDTPLTRLTGDTPNISHLVEFSCMTSYGTAEG